jgi:ubiquinone biosynthesis monooxygenase Coq7
MTTRQYSSIDKLLILVDQATRTLFGRPPTTGRASPASAFQEAALPASERQRAARLMRVNHCGEVCAQALYQGQALNAQHESVRTRLERAAAEENDHLEWCAARLRELGAQPSVLNPLFYAGSFLIGAVSGTARDRWNLGFLVETERQVVSHLEGHLQQLADEDHKTRAILAVMKADEQQHAAMAAEAGGAELPLPVRLLMKTAAKVMTQTSYWI